MRIKMLTTSAGPTPEQSRTAGQEYEVPDAEAKELIDGGYAVDPQKLAAEKQADLERRAAEKRAKLQADAALAGEPADGKGAGGDGKEPAAGSAPGRGRGRNALKAGGAGEPGGDGGGDAGDGKSGDGTTPAT